MADSKAKYNALNSFTARIQMSANIGAGETGGQGTIYYLKEGDVIKVRQEMTMSATTSAGGTPQKVEQKMMLVVTGPEAYVEQTAMGQTQVVRQKPDQVEQALSYGPRKIEALALDKELKILPEQKLDGREVYVVEAIQRAAENVPGGKMALYVAKDTGLMVLQELFDEKNQLMTSSRLLDIKPNADIPAETFQYTPPEGVKVLDLSNRAQP